MNDKSTANQTEGEEKEQGGERPPNKEGMEVSHSIMVVIQKKQNEEVTYGCNACSAACSLRSQRWDSF